MRIGLFGGTFNPPHNIHVRIAKSAISQLKLDKLIVMPCGDPPHKTCDVDKYTRFEMAKIAFDGIAEISDFEISRLHKSYTINSLLYLKKLYPDSELFLIIGGDSLANFRTWYCPEEIAKLATIVVADRGRKTSKAVVERVEQDFGATVKPLLINTSTVSSTEIKLRYQFGLDNSNLVPQDVQRYVVRNNLYYGNRPMIDKLRTYITPERFNHTYYVVKRGLELARDDEKDKVFVACLLHDCAKSMRFFDYGRYGFEQPSDMPGSVVHSFLGAEVAKRDFGISDPDILNAIAYHTTGRPNMSRLEKIVYVADKTEETRPYPLSHLKKGSLDTMFINCLKEAYQVCLARHDDSICPLSEQTLEYYCGKR